MNRDGHLWLSAFLIKCAPEALKGDLVPCEKLEKPGRIHGRMQKYKNARGRKYEENHLEEWIARQPKALFGDNRMLILASQNHAHLEEKIDLLFIDTCGQFHIVELKIVDVAQNGGVVPYAIYNEQMQKYVSFVNACKASFPDSMSDACRRFSKEFYRAARLLSHDLQATFGKSSWALIDHTVVEVYVASGCDDYAVDYLTSQGFG